MAIDRNFVARKQFEEQQRVKQLNKQVREAVSSGSLTVVDRIGQTLEKGALVVWRPPFDLVFEVLDAVPILDPGAPPGAMRVVLTCTTSAGIPAGQPQMNMIRIGTQRSEGHAELDPVGETPVEPVPEGTDVVSAQPDGDVS